MTSRFLYARRDFIAVIGAAALARPAAALAQDPVRRLGMLMPFLEDDPEQILQGLRSCGVRVDLFTFLQRLPDTTPKYQYPMEWDNVAALPVSTFDDWFSRQINFKVRNKVRLAEKRNKRQTRQANNSAAPGLKSISGNAPSLPHRSTSAGRNRLPPD